MHAKKSISQITTVGALNMKITSNKILNQKKTGCESDVASTILKSNESAFSRDSDLHGQNPKPYTTF